MVQYKLEDRVIDVEDNVAIMYLQRLTYLATNRLYMNEFKGSMYHGFKLESLLSAVDHSLFGTYVFLKNKGYKDLADYQLRCIAENYAATKAKIDTLK